MPELPEVEALAQDLRGRLVGRAISRIDLAAFSALKIALGLHWLEPENTVAGVSELQQIIAAAASSRSMGLQFRYLDAAGFPEALEAAFQHVGGGIGYRASYEPYIEENTLLVNLQLKYP